MPEFTTFDAVISCHNWPIKCLSFRVAELNLRGACVKPIFFWYISLCSKRFQSSYCAKVRAGAKKKGGKGRGRGEEETLARKPHDSGKRPLIFHGSVDL